MATSPYIVTWVEFTANSGKVLKSDIQIIEGRKYYTESMPNGKYYKHFPNKAAAIAFIQNFDKKLKKQYTCRLCTDKQFGTAKNFDIKFTKRQLEEIYTL